MKGKERSYLSEEFRKRANKINNSCVATDPSILAKWNKVCEETDMEIERWAKMLREELGVKAAHPDDGWVNREKNYVKLVYPYFYLGLQTGDLIALGGPEKYRIVKVIYIKFEGRWGSTYSYYFQELKTKKPKISIWKRFLNIFIFKKEK